MPSIFTLTLTTKACLESRCIGFFWSEEEAISQIKNISDEALYDYLILEEFGAGIHAHSMREKWFIYIGDGAWQPCNKPDFVSNVVNWGIG